MTNLSVVVFVTLLAASGLSGGWLLAEANECRRLDPCRCEYEDGKGIDLNQVVAKGDPHMETMDPKTLDKYFFQPCQDIKYLPQPNTDTDCSSGDGYALCRFNNATQQYQKLGTIKDSTFQSDSNGHQFLVFQLRSIVTSFQLLCLEDEKSYIYVNQDQPSVVSGNNTKLFLFSPFACPITIEEISKPSTGGVLLILFLISTFTYFTIGSIVRFMYLGARGIEVIPNLDFWKDLPGLVRDGIRFLQNGCRVERRAPDPDSYDAI